MYATGEHKPTILTGNAYSTVINSNNATFVEFTSTRPLQATAPDSYVIPLDQMFSIVYSFRLSPTLEYHGRNNRGTTNIELHIEGVCTFKYVPAI